jgi:hypothetical protein
LLFRYRLVALRPALMDAILMNGTLKWLCLHLSWYADDGMLLPEVFQAAARNKHMQDLTLRISGACQPTLLKEEVWVPTLCQRECTIEKLCLFGIKLGIDCRRHGTKHFCKRACHSKRRSLLLRSQLDTMPLQVIGICGSSFQQFERHFALWRFLMGEKSMLESLTLECNNIRVDDVALLDKFAKNKKSPKPPTEWQSFPSFKILYTDIRKSCLF